MGSCRAELGNSVCKGREGRDMEDRVAVLAVEHASLGEDDRDEVDARAVEQRYRGGVCQELQ